MNQTWHNINFTANSKEQMGLPVDLGPSWLGFSIPPVAPQRESRISAANRAGADYDCDALMQGWIKALEEREYETASHCRRVVAMTVLLARAMGVLEAEMVHYRRGALLHDIGKMGIPDSILQKPGPLTEAEWEIMRMHPVYAYRLIATIPYLTKALAIPYCHHERWNGAGYPRGLKGEGIPLAARIFSVVDVFDALTSERPYNHPWPIQNVKAYLALESGQQFDPRVVNSFLALLEQEPMQ